MWSKIWGSIWGFLCCFRRRDWRPDYEKQQAHNLELWQELRWAIENAVQAERLQAKQHEQLVCWKAHLARLLVESFAAAETLNGKPLRCVYLPAWLAEVADDALPSPQGKVSNLPSLYGVPVEWVGDQIVFCAEDEHPDPFSFRNHARQPNKSFLATLEAAKANEGPIEVQIPPPHMFDEMWDRPWVDELDVCQAGSAPETITEQAAIPPFSVGVRTSEGMIKQAVGGSMNLAQARRLASKSPGCLIFDWFAREVVV